jgi:hypothetical protein
LDASWGHDKNVLLPLSPEHDGKETNRSSPSFLLGHGSQPSLQRDEISFVVGLEVSIAACDGHDEQKDDEFEDPMYEISSSESMSSKISFSCKELAL